MPPKHWDHKPCTCLYTEFFYIEKVTRLDLSLYTTTNRGFLKIK